MSEVPLAHISCDGRVQTLSDHLSSVSNICREYCSDIGLSEVGFICGLVHDLGKTSNEFQEYLLGNTRYKRGDIDHSTAGAQFLSTMGCDWFDYYKQSPLNAKLCEDSMNVIELCILSHHSGLINCLSVDGDDRFSKRLNKELGLDNSKLIFEKMDPFVTDGVREHLPSAIEELSDKINEIVKTTEKTTQFRSKCYFRVGLLSRYILSCLIDADHQDTRSFTDNMNITLSKSQSWDVLCSRFDEYNKKLDSDGNVNKIRQQVSEECYLKSSCNTGVYTLSVPTGGGKTLASLRFALNHAKKNGLNRIIYVIPYTSIIDQNAQVMRNVLEKDGDKIVLEYHSNIEMNDDELSVWKYYSDSWNAQIIVTTMVQYLNTLFASGSSNIKKMHNLSKSVLIFDEIQTLPIKCTYMFNESVNFLSSVCGSTILLCTATQPFLSKVEKFPLIIETDGELMSEPKHLDNQLKRCEAQYINPEKSMSSEEIVDFVVKKSELFNSILIVTNTKRAAAEIFNGLNNRNCTEHNLFHLSTNMCPAHRKSVLKNVKQSLLDEKTICVSTQLIEAGVDLDFQCVIRMLAGIDSITQAAGRCNRNGQLDHMGSVYVIKSEEKISSLIDISKGRRCSQDVLREFSDPLSPDALSRYYEYYFFERSCDMGYPNGNTTLFELLSTNKDSKELYTSRTGNKIKRMLVQSFKEGNTLFKVIEENDTVIVPYDQNSKDLIARLCAESGKYDLYETIRDLQKYSINVYDVTKLTSSGIVKEIVPESGIFVLVEGYYDERLGMSRTPVNKAMIF